MNIYCEHLNSREAFLPLSEEAGGGNSLPPPVTLVVKEAIMGKVEVIVHKYFN